VSYESITHIIGKESGKRETRGAPMYYYRGHGGQGPTLVNQSYAFIILMFWWLGGLSLRGAQACSCMDKTICDSLSYADVVLRAKATAK